MPGWFINSGMLYQQAREAATQASTAQTVKAKNDAALNAIVFAFIALESFMNELSDFAGEGTMGPSLAIFSSLMEDLEQAKASIEVRFQFAKWILSKESYDKGKVPYQDFALLVKLRNAIIHLRADKTLTGPGNDVPQPPKFLETLRQKGLVQEYPSNVAASFLTKISTPQMARWACDTVVAMVKSIVDVLPHTSIRLTFQKVFGLES